MDTNVTEFATPTRKVKRGFAGCALFLVVTFTIAGAIGGQPWEITVTAALVFPFGFLVFIWIYGTIWIFDRCYAISDVAITLSRSGRMLKRISWQDVARVSKGHAYVAAYDGRRISFNLPPPDQVRALGIIEERLKTRDDAAEQTGSS